MGVPGAYQRQGGEPVASYNFTDIADQTGTVIYNGCMTGNSGATSYFLTTQTPHSGSIKTQRSTAGTTTMNFDTSVFNLPRTAKGTAYATIPIGGANAVVNHAAATVQKVLADASTENLSSEAEAADHTWGTGALGGGVDFLSMPLTQTIIKKGEKIRLVVKLVQLNAGEGEIGHDPQDRDAEYILPSTQNTHTTKLVFYLPFRLDLP